MGVSSGSDEVGLGLGWGQIIVRWSPGLYWKFSPASQGSRLEGPGRGGGSFGRGGMGESRRDQGWRGMGLRSWSRKGSGATVLTGYPANTGVSPQSEDQEEIQEAVHACSRLFGALLARGELFVGQLPSEEMVLTGECPGGPSLDRVGEGLR